MTRDAILIRWASGWLEGFAPESYSERQLEELDRLTKAVA